MGRRSINSTKAGKFMNPTDQARKEARRKELKKNKKQRQQVREAVIKQKDPRTLIAEMEELDKLEFTYDKQPKYTAKVVQDKRKRLKEAYNKIYKFYQKEDPKMAHEMKMMENDYDRRYNEMAQLHEQCMQAQKVKLEEIPLPSMLPDMPPPSMPFITPLLSGFTVAPPPPPPPLDDRASQSTKGILKKPSWSKIHGKKPPGPPSGSPPDLIEFDKENDETEGRKVKIDDSLGNQSAKKLRFTDNVSISQIPAQIPTGMPPTLAASHTFNAQSKPGLMQKPMGYMPPLLAPPHPPPPAPVQPAVPTSVQQARNLSQMSNRPAPYPQTAQQNYSNLQSIQQKPQPPPPQPPVIPQQAATSSSSTSSTIEAKPVLRNKMAELTRFVPTTVLVKRAEPSSTAKRHEMDHERALAHQQPYDYMSQRQQHYSTYNPVRYQHEYPPTTTATVSSSNNQTSKGSNNKQTGSTDAAYESFMKEIHDLL